jgi:hypothetical protein
VLDGAPHRNGLRSSRVNSSPLALAAGRAIALVLGLCFSVRREHYEEPGPDADETRFPRDRSAADSD